MRKTKKRRKRDSGIHLSLDDRINIEIAYREGRSFREIAAILGGGRSASTICREVAGKPRRGNGKYQAHIAHKQAFAKREARGKRPRLKNNLIRAYTVEKLKIGWSPEQISIRLPIDHKGQNISPEAIYQFVYAQIYRKGNGKIRKGCEDLRAFLPRRHKRRATKGCRSSQKTERPELPSIENRPKEVDKRKELGHWEDDTMTSRKSKGRLKTINERVSGLVLIKKIKDGSINESNRAVLEKLNNIPSTCRLTLTRDRGTENFGYQKIEEALELSCYFAHPYCSHERGSNENLNGLIRRFLPKGTDFSKVDEARIAQIEYLLNTRPRKRLKGLTPYEVFFNKTGVALKC
jgi:IS30 family transposase